MKPDIKCIRLCVRKGSKYGLWSENHVYVLEPQRQAASFAAQNVEVTGTMRNDTIHFGSIKIGSIKADRAAHPPHEARFKPATTDFGTFATT